MSRKDLGLGETRQLVGTILIPIADPFLAARGLDAAEWSRSRELVYREAGQLVQVEVEPRFGQFG